MQSIQDIVKEYTVSGANTKTERGELLCEFLENVNAERDKKLKPITWGKMAQMLGHIETQDLYAFLSMCKDRKNRSGFFSKFFWWALRAK